MGAVATTATVIAAPAAALVARPESALVEILRLAGRASPVALALYVYSDEALFRHLAALPGAEVWGIVALPAGSPTPTVCWSVSVALDGARVTSALTRPANAAEVAAVDRWLLQDSGARTGILRAIPGGA